MKSLLQASRHVGDLFEDLRDGHNLISLLEVLSGEHLVSIPNFVSFRDTLLCGTDAIGAGPLNP